MTATVDTTGDDTSDAPAPDPVLPPDVPAPGPPAPADDVADDRPGPEVAEALPRALKVIGVVVAPSTLLTALLFYFGLLHVTGFFRYLGVNYTALDLTPTDFLLRSADGLFVPLTVLACGAVTVVWVHRLLAGRRRRDRGSALPLLAAATVTTGTVLVIVSVIGVADRLAFAGRPEVPGLCLAAGVLVLAYAMHLVRVLLGIQGDLRASAAVVEWGAIFVLVSVGLFWAVGSYAIGVGTGRGQDMHAALPTWPDAILYSERDLRLEGPGLREVRCTEPGAAFDFRYDGLKLVMQSGGQYLFLPAGWSRESGAAVLLPRTDTVRLEFAAPGTARPESC